MLLGRARYCHIKAPFAEIAQLEEGGNVYPEQLGADDSSGQEDIIHKGRRSFLRFLTRAVGKRSV